MKAKSQLHGNREAKKTPATQKIAVPLRRRNMDGRIENPCSQQAGENEIADVVLH
jgi:hypothetical protein